ncbi:MAG TPA: penicillin-binding transpeptidase domain-containing protein [Pyrinomonadaceae bacterium]|nr:penicillin-binding transpeptidase domain-containing protein [Pyrinomonadaceae bacterium]HMP64876.1 penicillin-binding transpeptidase domain-containing protein [Pyrinomonadaceae bacterium]
MKLFFLLQIDWSKLSPDSLFGGQVLERVPAGLSLLYIVGVGILLGFLTLTFLDNFRKTRFLFEFDLPKDVRKRLTQTLANRSIRQWQCVFILLALSVFGFQAYWTYFAGDVNEQFQSLAYKDLRARRTTAANLRGWMFDRSGQLGSSLAYYRAGKSGDIQRAYALEKELAHLLGTERGTPGLERTLFLRNADPMPEAWDVLTTIKDTQEDRDVRITIDRDLQAYIAAQLDGRKGSIVVLDPQNGDILAMFSNPSYNLAEANDLDSYLKLEANRRDKPLLNRSTREFYIPGSTFKLFTVIAAFRAARQNAVFPSYPDGFRPTRGSLPIVDATQKRVGMNVSGACSGGCQPKDITTAFKVSSNQYFAQLAIALGRERIHETAELMGIAGVETPGEALMSRFFPSILNTSTPAIANALAPQRSTIVTGKDISAFDIGLEGMGQGYAGQMTPLQMAMITAVAGNMEGKLMKPRIEADQPPAMFSQVLSPQQAAAVRQIMATVTEEPGGTGTVIAGRLAGTGIRTGGKTGTAEKETPLYDEKTGQLRTVKKKRRNASGEWEEYDAPVMFTRSDSWFITIAPLERPRLAIAVVVEGGGYGSRTAAPIAANVILKARELGLLGDQYKPKAAPQKPQQRRR